MCNYAMLFVCDSVLLDILCMSAAASLIFFQSVGIHSQRCAQWGGLVLTFSSKRPTFPNPDSFLCLSPSSQLVQHHVTFDPHGTYPYSPRV